MTKHEAWRVSKLIADTEFSSRAARAARLLARPLRSKRLGPIDRRFYGNRNRSLLPRAADPVYAHRAPSAIDKGKATPSLV